MAKSEIPPHLTVVWGKLMQELADAVSFSRAVDIRDLVFWKAAEKLIHLSGEKELQAGQQSGLQQLCLKPRTRLFVFNQWEIMYCSGG